MKNYEPKDIRNIVFLSHSGAGKTTLAEAMLYNAGATSRLGKVAEGTSILDYEEEEKERKTTIKLSVASFEYTNLLVNIIDTPGYFDFYGDVICGATAADSCIIVINATIGIQPGTIKAKELAEKNNLPIIIFVNQIKKGNINIDNLIKEIKELFGKNSILITSIKDDSIIKYPDKDNMMESVASVEDNLIEKYLETGNITDEDIQRGLQIGIKERKLFPIYVGDAYENIGVKELLNDLIIFPQPEAKDENLSSIIFKTFVDPHLGDLRYVRVFSGKLEPATFVLNSTKNVEEKINQLYILKGKQREEVTSLGNGMIGAIVKLKNTKTGDTLTDKEKPVETKKIIFPESYVKMAIIPKTKKDEEKLSDALSKLHEEDPTIHSYYDVETKQTVIVGIGDLHLNVSLERIKKKYNVEVNFEKPKIHYRETITKTVEKQGKYKRQSGGHGQYGDCWIRFEPNERGKGIEFIDAIREGRIPKRFIPSIEKGLREASQKGVLAGFPTTDFKATLYDGSFHEVDSSDIAFKIAASIAFREGLPLANPTLLEPIMEVEITTPSEFLGDVMGNITSRRGRVEKTESMGRYQKIFAIVPEAELFGFSASLNAQTQGMASFTQKLLYYEVVPKELQPKIIEEYKKMNE